MQYANNKNKERVEPSPNIEATCPGCGEEVIAKCGTINVWHFAHKSGTDCDSWYEPESEWHRDWKNNFPTVNQEVTIRGEMGYHRADVLTKTELVIELQASTISIEEILEREQFYGDMIWIVKADTFKDRFDIRFNHEKCIWTFRWKHPRRCWGLAKKPVYLDFGEYHLFKIGRIYPSAKCGGWGEAGIYKEDFIEKLKNEI